MNKNECLKRIKAAKKDASSCVAYAEFNNIVYYSFTTKFGEKRKSYVEGILARMYKKSTKQLCEFEDSITILDPNNCKYYTDYDNSNIIWQKFKNNKKWYYMDYIGITKSNPTDDRRNYTCVERKIIGYLYNNQLIKIGNSGIINKHRIEIYVAKHPCPLCVPLVDNVIYLDDKKIIVDEIYESDVLSKNILKTTII